MATVCTTAMSRSTRNLGCQIWRLQSTVYRFMSLSSSGVSEHYQEVNGVNIHYKKTGHGDHPLLLFPGALGSGETDFSPQLKGLNREKFTTIAFDPRGYGKSRPPERDFPKKYIQRDADDAAELMKALGFRKYSILGWCGGGTAALIMAANNPLAIQKMVLWGASAYNTKDDLRMYEAMRDIATWSEGLRAPMIAQYGEKYLQKLWERTIDAYSVYLTENDGDICKGALHKIECPTLIIHGQKDVLITQGHTDFLLANIKGSKLVNWPDGKHNLHLRFPEKFNKLVEDFLT